MSNLILQSSDNEVLNQMYSNMNNTEAENYPYDQNSYDNSMF